MLKIKGSNHFFNIPSLSISVSTASTVCVLSCALNHAVKSENFELSKFNFKLILETSVGSCFFSDVSLEAAGLSFLGGVNKRIDEVNDEDVAPASFWDGKPAASSILEITSSIVFIEDKISFLRSSMLLYSFLFLEKIARSFVYWGFRVKLGKSRARSSHSIFAIFKKSSNLIPVVNLLANSMQLILRSSTLIRIRCCDKRLNSSHLFEGMPGVFFIKPLFSAVFLFSSYSFADLKSFSFNVEMAISK